MKVLIFLSLIVLCKGLQIPSAPDNVKTTTHIDYDETELYFIVTWDKVESSDAAEPVLGYKVCVYVNSIRDVRE